jgi:hypothetical protein
LVRIEPWVLGFLGRIEPWVLGFLGRIETWVFRVFAQGYLYIYENLTFVLLLSSMTPC